MPVVALGLELDLATGEVVGLVPYDKGGRGAPSLPCTLGPAPIPRRTAPGSAALRVRVQTLVTRAPPVFLDTILGP